jgi:hypothetical protein
VASAFLLTGCLGSSGFPDPGAISVPPPPVAATRPCEPPQPAPADVAGLTGGEREAIWIADRVNLVNCGAQHWVLIQWADGVQAAFAPVAP